MKQRDSIVRSRLLKLIHKYPGLHVRELSRQLKTSVALVEYHLDSLAKNGLVELEADQRFVRLHGTQSEGQVASEDRPALHALRSEKGLAIALALLLEGTQSHGSLSAALDLRKATLSFHLRKLEAVGLVGKLPGGAYELTDSERVRTLLRTHQPTPDLRDQFASMWAAFYDD